MLDVDLSGRRTIVTGAGRGIGRAIALALARCGAAVAIVYREDVEAAERTAAEIGSRAIVVRGDVADPVAAQGAVTAAVERLGGVDVLVNNAGVIARAPLLELAAADWRRVLATNLDGSFYAGQAAAREMVRAGTRGAIVNVTSVHASIVAADLAAYVVSKAAQWALTRQMAYELAPHGIRVNAVAPGLTESDINRELLADPAYRAERVARIPLHRICEPEDQADAVLYLVSDAARAVTGEQIGPAGGASLIGAVPHPVEGG